MRPSSCLLLLVGVVNAGCSWTRYDDIVENSPIALLNRPATVSGIIPDERARQAAVVTAENVAGVKEVDDHLCWVDPMSGLWLLSPEDEQLAARG